jgi:hypothetical protein
MFIHLVMRRGLVVALLACLLGSARTASAQFELAGSWTPVPTEDVQNDSFPVDYLSLPLTDEGRTRALSYDESQKSMIERQCIHWGAAYTLIGPFGLNIAAEVEPVRGRVVSYTFAAWEDRMSTTIWMDGRPHPSPDDLHTQAGFTTGRWEGNTLLARTTHMKAAWIRKTGVPLSDEAEINWRFYRHGAVLTVLMEVTDPSYLAEPYMISKSFQVSPNPVATQTPCVSTFEGREPGDSVPHFAPDKNPFADEFVKMYNLPREAVLGYPETLYPEYRKRIKDGYQPPPPCKTNCGAALPPAPR